MLRGGARAFQQVAHRLGPACKPINRRAWHVPTKTMLPALPPSVGGVTSVGTRSFASEFLTGANNAYLEEMYDVWSQDPSSVHKSWDIYFRTGQSAHVPNSNSGVVTNVDFSPSGSSTVQAADFRVLSLLRAYRSRGHEVANLNPILPPPKNDLLDIKNFGFSEADLDMPLRNLESMGLVEDARLLKNADANANSDGTTTLGELVAFLKQTYTGQAAFEFSHLNDPAKTSWLKERVERIPVSEFCCPLSFVWQRVGHVVVVPGTLSLSLSLSLSLLLVVLALMECNVGLVKLCSTSGWTH